MAQFIHERTQLVPDSTGKENEKKFLLLVSSSVDIPCYRNELEPAEHQSDRNEFRLSS